MARLPRYSLSGQPQHIIHRGNNRETIFVVDEDYQFYLECLLAAASEHGVEIHAYVLMMNHLHLLVTPKTEKSISKFFQSVGRKYVQYFNHRYGRSGTLWDGRYKATVIESDVYLLDCCRYVELNPVRIGMVKHCEDYPWSSYHQNALGKKDDLVTAHEIYHRLGDDESEKQVQYKALFKHSIPEAFLCDIRHATNKGWALGSEDFLRKVEVLNQRQVKPKKRGRQKQGVA